MKTLKQTLQAITLNSSDVNVSAFHSITLSHKNICSYLAPLERLYKNVSSLTIFANLFAYVKKKQYLCTLNRARKVYMQMIINY